MLTTRIHENEVWIGLIAMLLMEALVSLLPSQLNIGTVFRAFPRQVWARNFDGLIGPFEQKYDDLKTTIGGLYEVAKGKHALGLVNLVRPRSQMANMSNQRSSSKTIFHVGFASHVHVYLFCTSCRLKILTIIPSSSAGTTRLRRTRSSQNEAVGAGICERARALRTAMETCRPLYVSVWYPVRVCVCMCVHSRHAHTESVCIFCKYTRRPSLVWKIIHNRKR